MPHLVPECAVFRVSSSPEINTDTYIPLYVYTSIYIERDTPHLCPEGHSISRVALSRWRINTDAYIPTYRQTPMYLYRYATPLCRNARYFACGSDIQRYRWTHVDIDTYIHL